MLGWAYYEGEGVPRDLTEAVKWWRKAADQGHLKAQASLGWAYYKGEGVPKDYAEAVKWYRKAAEKGDANAQSNLGWAYYKGEGVPRDYAQAFCWFSLAVKRSGEEDRYKYANYRDDAAGKLTSDQLAEARRMFEEEWEVKYRPNSNDPVRSR